MRLRGSLIDQYREIHWSKRRYDRGGCIQRYVDDIAKIVQEIPTQSILDYGCGKGLQYTEDKIHRPWGVMPTMFDPGVPGIDQLPRDKFDGVICSGVLEHIPEEELHIAFKYLTRYAQKWCFIVIGVGPTNKLLPDGRQAHVTLYPPEWWEHKVSKAFADSSAKVWLRFEP